MAFCNRQFVDNLNEIMRGPTWSDDGLFKLYLFCLIRASHNEYMWNGLHLHPGDMPLSERNLALDLGWSRNKLIRKMKHLQDSGLVSIISASSAGTLIHINNWSQNEARSYVDGANTEPGRYQDETNAAGPHGAQWRQNGTTANSACLKTMPTRYQNGAEPGSKLEPNPYIDKKDLFTKAGFEPLGFSDIWLAYPEHRRNRREEAAALVAKAMESGATVQSFIDALNVEKNSYSWSQNNGQYVPGIVKWLQRESWRNYVKPGTSLEDDEEWTSR